MVNLFFFKGFNIFLNKYKGFLFKDVIVKCSWNWFSGCVRDDKYVKIINDNKDNNNNL